MKPSPRHDFAVSVSRDAADDSSAIEGFFRGVFVVRLNHTISIRIIPQVDRRIPWPPEPPDELAQVRSVDEARRTTLVRSALSVTPDDYRAGTRESFTFEGHRSTVFYVAASVFEAMTV